MPELPPKTFSDLALALASMVEALGKPLNLAQTSAQKETTTDAMLELLEELRAQAPQELACVIASMQEELSMTSIRPEHLVVLTAFAALHSSP